MWYGMDDKMVGRVRQDFRGWYADESLHVQAAFLRAVSVSSSETSNEKRSGQAGYEERKRAEHSDFPLRVMRRFGGFGEILGETSGTGWEVELRNGHEEKRCFFFF